MHISQNSLFGAVIAVINCFLTVWSRAVSRLGLSILPHCATPSEKPADSKALALFSPSKTYWGAQIHQTRTHLSSGESLEAVMNTVDLVPAYECQPDGRPDGRIHACSRSSHVQNGQGEIGLRGRTGQSDTEKLISTSLNKDINCKGGHLSLDRLLEGQNLVDVPVVLKTPARNQR